MHKWEMVGLTPPSEIQQVLVTSAAVAVVTSLESRGSQTPSQEGSR
jgi:hypothetical protein